MALTHGENVARAQKLMNELQVFISYLNEFAEVGFPTIERYEILIDFLSLASEEVITDIQRLQLHSNYILFEITQKEVR